MPRFSDRRAFLRQSLTGSLTAGSVLGLGDLGFLDRLGAVSAAETTLDPKIVRLRPEIEPLVRLIEETPRDRLLETIGERVRQGLPYREVLAALLLAGVRNVQPRPSVGFKFHAVLVVNSAHLASLASPDAHRWLPIFWALDYFKSSQARDVREGNWTMGPVEETRVPAAHGAREAFVKAMEAWDVEAADAAVAGFVRTAGAQAVFEEFFRLGARDYRSIGHKAIFVSNAWRTLACIGWQHGEPVLRSLAYALLMHEGDNPAGRDGEPDRPWRRNRELVQTICAHCAAGGEPSEAARQELLEVLRDGSESAAALTVVKHLKAGVSPRSLWDAIFGVASDLVYRQPGIISLHAATTSNALHFAYQTTGHAETRAGILLQAASFLPLFRASSISRAGEMPETGIDALSPAPDVKRGPGALEEIFALLRSNPREATRHALGYLADPSGQDAMLGARELMDAARLLIFFKGNDAHDYKYSSAVLEDTFHLSPAHRHRFLAASLPLFTGSSANDNPLVERTRQALGG